MRSYREIAIEDDTTGFAAYLVVEPSDRALSFGGMRIDTSVTREMVADLARNMSLKLAVHGSPVGGAKAGVRMSPDDPRLKQCLRRFAEACRELLTSTTILGKDMGAQQWMLDEMYHQLEMPQLGLARRNHPKASCPERLFELEGYISNMTGKGVFWAIEQALGGRLRGARVLIQGFGVVGAGVAWHLTQAGARIVGVSDRDKAVLAPDGVDLETLQAARASNGVLDADKLPASLVMAARDELLTQPADVLVLAAGSYLVDRALAARVQASVVVEGANVALLAPARTLLHERSIRVVPDVVANSASAALVGHQIASGNTLAAQPLWTDIEANIKRSTDAVERMSKEFNIDSKSAFLRIMEAGPDALRSGAPGIPSAAERRQSTGS